MLTVATDKPVYPPWFVNNKPTNGQGYESAVAYAVAKKLGFDKSEVKWIHVPFANSYAPGPKSFDFEPVTIDDNPDFNSKSLRSNTVFRWEYRRGSTLYLVWNVSNSDDGRPGVFSTFRDLRTGFGAAGTQVLMVKFSYWLGL